MRTKRLLIIALTVAAGLQFVPFGLAQTPDAQGHWKSERRERFLANLSPEERTQLRAAHHKAMADPAVQAAKDRKRQSARDFRELKKAAMLRADPSLQPILDKLPARGRRNS
jgi:hypothetical protein